AGDLRARPRREPRSRGPPYRLRHLGHDPPLLTRQADVVAAGGPPSEPARVQEPGVHGGPVTGPPPPHPGGPAERARAVRPQGAPRRYDTSSGSIGAPSP